MEVEKKFLIAEGGRHESPRRIYRENQLIFLPLRGARNVFEGKIYEHRRRMTITRNFNRVVSMLINNRNRYRSPNVTFRSDMRDSDNQLSKLHQQIDANHSRCLRFSKLHFVNHSKVFCGLKIFIRFLVQINRS